MSVRDGSLVEPPRRLSPGDTLVKPDFTHRLAKPGDIEAIRELMAAATFELQKDFLTAEQLQVAGQFMGVDTTLISDQTYFLFFHDQGLPTETLVGCGGWGKRKTLYGGDHSPGRSQELLDPQTDRARIRAMYCHPAWARRGIGRMIMGVCESAAREAGFSKTVLGSTLAGQPLYEACGYTVIKRQVDVSPNGVEIPNLVMVKNLT
jgi:GNAT superfamily N-acetyltransferase